MTFSYQVLPREKNSETATVEYTVNDNTRTLSCSRFDYRGYRTNLRALYLTLEALRLADERGILRELAEAAFGFLEAPKAARPKRPWHEVLGVMPTAEPEIIKQAYRILSQDGASGRRRHGRGHDRTQRRVRGGDAGTRVRVMAENASFATRRQA